MTREASLGFHTMPAKSGSAPWAGCTFLIGQDESGTSRRGYFPQESDARGAAAVNG
jgi:hypothetical protein